MTIKFAALLAGSLAANALPAQAVPQIKLGAATELTGVEFSRLGSIRELADGRVLVADGGEKQLLIVDFAKSAAKKVGRVGSGPGEYRGLNGLLALPGDSTLVIDVAGGRWLLAVRDSFTAVIDGSDPALAVSRNPLGADANGHLLATRPARGLTGLVGNVNMANDSSWLVRIHRKTGRVDTLTKFRIRPSRVSVKGTAERPTSVEVVMNPISTGELSAVFPDGAIAIARLDPYRVDWIIGDRRVAGPPLPFTAVPVNAAEKEAIMRRMARATGEQPRDPESVNDWPEVFPPFQPGAALAGPDGTLWIRRAPSVRTPATDYDVIDRTGRLVRRLHLAANETIVGFGRASLYVVYSDDDDLQHLKRYPFPR